MLPPTVLRTLHKGTLATRAYSRIARPTHTGAFLSMDDLTAQTESGDIDTVIVGFTDIYGRMMGKRYCAEHFVNHGVAGTGTHACDYLLACDMDMNPIPGFKKFNYEKGYGDFHLVPDQSTLRRASWLDSTALILCDVHDNKTHELLDVAPRSLLQNQLSKMEKAGLKINAATELEYFTFKDTYRQAYAKNYHNLENVSDWVEDYHILQGTREEPFNSMARRALRGSGIEVETSKGEAAIGQHELNIRFDEALPMADNHVIYKQCLKEIADEAGMSVTFMAKPFADRAGSGCHVHLSLWKDGVNAFVGDQTELKVSDTFQHFLAGWIRYTPDLSVFLAPNVNSYKRFKEGSWAPTRLAWSFDNRTAGFRVVGSGPSLRIECRIPGADVNPYLLFASSIAAGMRGVEEKLSPPPMFEGDMYQASKLPRVPRSLPHAIDIFNDSKFARESFGDDVVDHYVNFFEAEQKAFEDTVTDWERVRYFERI